MAIPTGAGTEILYRTTINTQEQTATAFRWDKTNATTGTSSGTGYIVPADHIITVLSIVINNNSTTPRQMDLYVNDEDNDNIMFLNDFTLPSSETGPFVWNDKIVLVPGDSLLFKVETGGNADAYCTFIDQHY
jgi:hypothetical protein